MTQTNETQEVHDPAREGDGRRSGDHHSAGTCEKVGILSTEVPILSRNVLVIDTKMSIGIALLSLISVMLLGQSLYQIPVLRDSMNRQDAAMKNEIIAVSGEVTALKQEVGSLRSTVDTLEGNAYVLRSDITRVKKVANKNTAERIRPKGFFGK